MVKHMPAVVVFFCSFGFLIASISNEDYLEDDVWRLYSDIFPDDKFAPPIGNGHIATNVLSDTIYMNGFYNGYREDSHRARIQSTCSINVRYKDGKESRFYILDIAKGTFTQQISHTHGNINITYFAHRKYNSLLVVHATGRQAAPSDFNFVYIHGDPSLDLFNVTEIVVNNSTKYWSGYNDVRETTDLSRMAFHQVWTNIAIISDNTVKRQNNDTHEINWTWITSISTSKEEAFAMYWKAVDMGYNELFASHVKEWHNIWRNGHVRLSGNKELSRNINAAFYNILSSMPTENNVFNPFIGLSPGGKINLNKTGGPSNDYAGHVFWDMDTWVMPPIMLLYPQMARLIIDSRIRVLDRAKVNAVASGYSGARFPWEQAVSGVETCPWNLASKYQIHITADVSYAMRQYIYVSTTDAVMDLLKNNGSNLALEIARFWKSRVHKLGNEENDILGVMGPDEYHYNINNSIFTNYNAKLSLMLPLTLDDKFNIYNSEYKEELLKMKQTADKLKLLFNKEGMFHPQFEGFRIQDKIKQSDVVLLGFPLMMSMKPEIRRNDLFIYENVTDKFGPDTGTWSMHTVGWLELNDEQKAADMFKMLLRNINGPFKVFSEKPASSPEGPRCVNFITGAGGLLQAVFFGYGGIRIRESTVDINPHILPGVREWAIRGIKYKGFTFDLRVNHSHVQFILTNLSGNKNSMYVTSSQHGTTMLDLNNAQEFVRGKFTLNVKEANSCPWKNNAKKLQWSRRFVLISFLSLLLYV